MKEYHVDLNSGNVLRGRSPNKQYSVLVMSKAELSDAEMPVYEKALFEQMLEHILYCKAEVCPNCVLGTLKVPEFSSSVIKRFSEFGFYLSKNTLYLVGDESRLESILSDVLDSPFGGMSLNKLLFWICEHLIIRDYIKLQEIDDELSDFEDDLTEDKKSNVNQYILKYRKSLSVIHSYYDQLVDLSELIQMNVNNALSVSEVNDWVFFGNRAERLHNHVELLREKLNQINDHYQAKIAEQQNRIMTWLTVVTTIFMPLTLITGWYGMNFKGMPELSWKIGYPVVIVISIAIIVIEIIIFKKKKML